MQVITLFAIVPPITQYFIMFSFAGSIPTSFVVHIMARTVTRYLRKYLALRRGRQVEGVGRDYEAWENTGSIRKSSLDYVPFKAFKRRSVGRASLRESARAPPASVLETVTEADEESGEATPAREESRRTTAEARFTLRRDVSAYITSSVLDSTQSLADRRSRASAANARDGFGAEDRSSTARWSEVEGEAAPAAAAAGPGPSAAHTSRASSTRYSSTGPEQSRASLPGARPELSAIGRQTSRKEALVRAQKVVDVNASRTSRVSQQERSGPEERMLSHRPPGTPPPISARV